MLLDGIHLKAFRKGNMGNFELIGWEALVILSLKKI